jgi:hypothetical protein
VILVEMENKEVEAEEATEDERATKNEGWWDERPIGESNVSPPWYNPRQQVHKPWTAIVSL